MHECVKKLLGNVDNPEEEEIESLCKLLATVGSMLDIQKVSHRSYLATISNFISYRICSSSANANGLHAVAAPSTIAQIHENVIIFYSYQYFNRLNRT
jgi:translation initiation factor 4G